MSPHHSFHKRPFRHRSKSWVGENFNFWWGFSNIILVIIIPKVHKSSKKVHFTSLYRESRGMIKFHLLGLSTGEDCWMPLRKHKTNKSSWCRRDLWKEFNEHSFSRERYIEFRRVLRARSAGLSATSSVEGGSQETSFLFLSISSEKHCPLSGQFCLYRVVWVLLLQWWLKLLITTQSAINYKDWHFWFFKTHLSI